MNYPETTEYLFSSMPSFQSVGAQGYKPGLERISSFCQLLNSPHLSYPVVHIAGTNGKGSTSHMLASVLSSAGYRVGLFTSPHLCDFRERIRVGREMISESEVVDFVERWRGDMERLSLSFFEMTAAMAFDHFARCEVDVAVIETGLGGRLDATNIVDPLLSIITNISIDHTQYLGSTLAEIAREKGGIIKSGVPVVVGERGAEYSSVLESIALERGSSITFADDCYRIVRSGYDVDSLQYVDLQGLRDGALCRYELDLVGGYQQHNLKSLLSAIDLINSDSNILLSIPPRAIADGLRRVVEATSLKGRWQTLSRSPRIVCDTGHNEAGIREVAQQLLRESYNRLICILGFTAEKDLRKLLPLLPAEAHYIFTRAKGERSMALAKIEEVARELGLSYDLESDVEEALCRGRGLVGVDDLLFVGGSTFVVAEVSGLTF